MVEVRAKCMCMSSYDDPSHWCALVQQQRLAACMHGGVKSMKVLGTSSWHTISYGFFDCQHALMRAQGLVMSLCVTVEAGDRSWGWKYVGVLLQG